MTTVENHAKKEYNSSMKNTAPFAPVINADNKMITEGVIGWIIWIYQIIKGTTNRTNNIS